jgi:predicted molibdopterin-dependent oxidoreductase YjgC
MKVSTTAGRAQAARTEAFDRILRNHELYCTVCDNNNGNCTVHNTTKLLGVEHQHYPFQAKPYEVDNSNPFYRYDPNQCILCGRCVAACQNLQVNETLSIRWEDPHPRVLWDGGAPIGESSCVSCGHCVTVCPCNALMEKTMLGHAGFLTGFSKPVLDGMIDVVKGSKRNRLQPRSAGFRSGIRHADHPRPAHQNRLHLLRRRMQLRCLDQGPPHPESGAGRGPRQRRFHLHQRQVRLGFRQHRIASPSR